MALEDHSGFTLLGDIDANGHNITGIASFAATGLGTLGSLVVDTNTLVANATGYEDKVGIGTATPTARLHLRAGTATAGTAPIKFTTGTLLTTPETGTIEFYNDRFYITNVALRKIIDRSNGTIVASTTVANTTDETTIYTDTIPANALKVGNFIEVILAGQLSTHDASDSVTINLYLGSTLIGTATSTPKQVTDIPWHLNAFFTVRTVGETGTISIHGDIVTGETITYFNTPSVVLDTTAAEDLTVKVQWDNANADNTIQADQGITHFSN